MKSLSLLLVLNIIFCYTGLSANVCRSSVTQKTMNTGCHTTHEDDSIDGTTVKENSYNNKDATKEAMFMCHDALPNAPHGNDLNLKNILLYSVVINIPNPEINRVSSSYLSFETNKEYRPPDLFLLNSSFLI